MKFIVLVIAFFCFVMVSGCSNTVCGDGNCDIENGENDLSCPQDCSSFHLACDSGQCVVVEGTGADECDSDADLCPKCRAIIS